MRTRLQGTPLRGRRHGQRRQGRFKVPEAFGAKLPVDSRIVSRVASSAQMSAEQGGPSNVMVAWGGPQQYEQMAKIPLPQRVVFYAVKAGYTDVPTLEVVTGLTPKDVSGAVSKLVDRGMLSRSEVVSAKGLESKES